MRTMVLFAVLLLCAFEARAQPVPDSALQALQWRSIGPFRAGRVPAVTGVPGDPRTFWFGGSDGGVWKTEDAGRHWRNVSDCCFRMGAVGALAVAPSAHDTIYAGMGEPFPRGDVAVGDGVWRSDDAGKSWRHLGLVETRMIARVVVDPEDADHVYVAALGDVFAETSDRGVYESKDGGKSWRRILFVDQRSGAVELRLVAGVLYAATWDVQRRPWNFRSGGPGSRIFRSDDGGAHWTRLDRNPGMAAAPLGRIGLAISPANPERLYALVQAKDGGVFRSDDRGATWQRTSDSRQLRQRQWYFGRIEADPKDAGKVYAPQAPAIQVSTDGGKTFTPVRAEGGDNHELWIDPTDASRMILGNDIGATISVDGGKSWSRQDNQPTGAFYHVSVDEQFPFQAYGAQQEHATVAIASRNTNGWSIGREQWRVVAQWESGYVFADPREPWVTWASGSVAGLVQRNDARGGTRTIYSPWPEDVTGHGAAESRERFNWVFPLVVSQHAAGRLYAGSQHVLRSDDGGREWRRISDDLTYDEKELQQPSGGPIRRDGTSIEVYGTVFALAESPLAADELWAGTDDGRVWTSGDGGAKWREVTPRGLPKHAVVSSIEASRQARGTVVLAARREREGDRTPYLFRTTDGGAHWDAIADGLQRDESSFVVREDPDRAGLLYAGTLAGVYVSFDAGAHWQPLQRNLPRTAIHDLAISRSAGALVVATHGRGFWILDDLAAVRALDAATLQRGVALLRPQAATLAGGYRFEGVLEEGEGENYDNGAHLFWWLKEAPPAGAKVALDLLDADGNALARVQGEGEAALPAKAGLNAYTWNLRAGDDGGGPRLVPGEYRVRLGVGAAISEATLVVRDHPGSAATAADHAARFAFGREIQQAQKRVRETVQSIATLREAIAKRAGDARTKAWLAALAAAESGLVEPESDAYLDSVAEPVQVRSRLGTLAWVAEGRNAAPGRQERDVLVSLVATLDTRAAEVERIRRELEAAP